jgi:hypothetical protein
VARRARELGFITHVGVIHDGHGQVKPLGPREMSVYRQLRAHRTGAPPRGLAVPGQPRPRAAPNAGAAERGPATSTWTRTAVVHYCSQQRGRPGIPLEAYGRAEIEREYVPAQGLRPVLHDQLRAVGGPVDKWRSPQIPLAAVVPRARAAAAKAAAAAAPEPPRDRALVG